MHNLIAFSEADAIADSKFSPLPASTRRMIALSFPFRHPSSQFALDTGGLSCELLRADWKSAFPWQ